MKTWEKWYWGIIGVLFAFALTPLLGSGEKILVTVQGKGYIYSKGAYFGYLVLGYSIIFGIIWVVVRLIVNKGWSEKTEREREN